MSRSTWWRGSLFVAGAGILIGGPQHPGGTMAEMLAHPAWVRAHLWVLLGFLGLLAAQVLHRRDVALPPRSARWARLAIWATAIQAVEMVLHTAASVDHHNLVAGRATPVLSAHLAMAAVAYPLFGIVCSGWMIATSRDRTLGSPWIVWLGVAGALAHGAAAPLVILLEIPQARILFPMVMLLALWCVVATFWPVRAAARDAAGERAAGEALGAPSTPAAG